MTTKTICDTCGATMLPLGIGTLQLTRNEGLRQTILDFCGVGCLKAFAKSDSVSLPPMN